MSASFDQTFRRRLRPWLNAVGVVVILWSAAWLALAFMMDRTAGQAFAEAAARGVDIRCGRRGATGYPFALRLSCRDTSLTAKGITVTLSAFRAGVSLFHPVTLAADFDAPAEALSASSANGGRASWSDAGVAVWGGIGGLSGIDVRADYLSAILTGGTVSAGQFAARVEPSGSGSAITHHATDLAWSVNGSTLPPLESVFTALVSIPPNQLLRGRGAAPGAQVSGLSLNLRSGTVRMQATGDLAVDADGMVDGIVTIRMTGLDRLPTLLASLPDKARSLGTSVAGGIMAIGKPVMLDGVPAKEMALTIDHGTMRLGFMTLGRIPPL